MCTFGNFWSWQCRRRTAYKESMSTGWVTQGWFERWPRRSGSAVSICLERLISRQLCCLIVVKMQFKWLIDICSRDSSNVSWMGICKFDKPSCCLPKTEYFKVLVAPCGNSHDTVWHESLHPLPQERCKPERITVCRNTIHRLWTWKEIRNNAEQYWTPVSVANNFFASKSAATNTYKPIAKP